MSCVMQAKSAFLCVGGECFYNIIMAKKLAKLHCLGQNKIESYFSRIGVNAMNKNVALYNEMVDFFAGDARVMINQDETGKDSASDLVFHDSVGRVLGEAVG